MWLLVDQDLLLALRLRTVPAEYGTAETRVRARAVLIREERVIPSPATGRVTLLVNEGRHVRTGDAVIEVEDTGTAATLAAEVARIDQRALDAEAEYVAERSRIERRIEEVNAALRRAEERLSRAVAEGERSGAASAERERDAAARELAELSSRLEAIARAKDEELARLAGRRRELLAVRPADTSIVRAPASGIVSFQVDGLEEVSPRAPFQELFGARETVPARVQDGAHVTYGGPLFRVVDPAATVYVALEARGSVSLAAGEPVSVAFDRIPERTFPGRLVESVQIDRTWYGRVALQAVDDSLVHQRMSDVTVIARRAEGIVVPRSAVIERGGETGVYIMVGRSPVFRRVRVLGGNDERVAIDSAQGVPVGAPVVRNPGLLR